MPSRNEVENEDRELIESLNKFWRHESSGLADNEADNANSDDEQSTKIEIQRKEDRYSVSLPWKSDITEPLPSDLEFCRNRLNSLYDKLKMKPELLREYDEIFREQLNSHVIEKVPEAELNCKGAHYICHFGVIRSDRETTKLRIVFDGSAKSTKETLSLNDRLDTGGNYMPLLFDTLTRFRSHPIAITADIEKAFLQIEINEKDRDILRFLWYDDVSKSNPTIVQYRYRRHLFGLTCSPALLGKTIRHHVSKYAKESPKVVKVLSRLYADDLSCSVKNTDEALALYKQAKSIMKEGGFNLRKWQSNDKSTLNEIIQLEQQEGNLKPQENTNSTVKEDDQTYSEFVIGSPSASGYSKVLGVNWDSHSDKFVFDLRNIVDFANSLLATKRSVLRIVAKIFDPLGCLSVYTVNFKILFQQLCIDKIDWDLPLYGSYLQRYETLVKGLDALHNTKITRCLFEKQSPVKTVEIHGFSDKSERAQGAVVYLRIEYVDGNIDVKFLASKAKVSPVKAQSIPRLELLGACLLAKLVASLKGILSEEIGNERIHTYYWVDSYSALCWIRNVKPWTQHVRNRVNQILQTSNRAQWFYCPGPSNPADLPSREQYANLADNLFWWEGPAFLKENRETWPEPPGNSELEIEKAMIEKLKNQPEVTHTILTQSDVDMKEIIKIERFSSKGKLVRTFAWVLRFINNMKSIITNKKLNKDEIVSATECRYAETTLTQLIQSECFKNEIDYLLSDDESKKRKRVPLYVNQFNLFLDKDKILRCRARVGNSRIIESGKTPILIPSKHYYSELLITEYHQTALHGGIRDTLNLMRQHYWVLRGREQVKGAIRKCIICKKLEGIPFTTKYSPDLPQFRVDEGSPFTHVGIDFAGPLYVKGDKVDNANIKTYVCLFTCASTRAVNLELVESLTVESFLRAFRRFCARRGLPSTVISANAKTYKSAAKEVRKLIRSPRLKEYFRNKTVEWKFIVELAPFQGGFWERLIRSTKRCLVKIIGRASLGFDELSTILVEIESVINSRPLIYVYDDSEGISYPLTPSQLINGRNLDCEPNQSYFETVNTYDSLSKRAKYHRRLLTSFVARWKNEYLLSLLEAYKPRGNQLDPSIKINDVCILKNEQVKRAFWKICKVVELIVGADGSVRSARVEVISKDKGKTVLTR